MSPRGPIRSERERSSGLVRWSAWGCGLAFFLLGAFPLYNVDAYGHLAQGRQIAELGAVPRVDPFSFWRATPQPWANYEWAYDLATWLLYDRLGPNALIVVKCLLLGLLGFLLVQLAHRLAERRPAAAPLALAVLLFLAPLARLRFTVRPQLVGLLFPAVLLLGIFELFRADASRARKAWVIVGLGVLQVAWVNLHGSHLLGFVITILFLAFSIRTPAAKPTLVLLVAQCVATACNPFGFGIVSDAVAHVFVPEYRAVVTEWAPWSPEQPIYLLLGPVVAAVLLLVTMRPVTKSGRFGLAYAVLCVVFTLMAFRSLRFIAHPLLYCAPLIAAGLSAFARVTITSRRAAVLVAASFVWAALLSPRLEPFVPFGFGEPRLGHAWASAEVLEKHVEKPRILAPIQDSWPLMFGVPSGQFLVDGRVPFYGPIFIRQIANSFSDPEAFQKVVDGFQVNAVVVDHTRRGQVPAIEHLDTAAHWELAQVENRQSLFVRKGSSSTLEPLRVIGPGFAPGRLLDPTVSEVEIEKELRRIGDRTSSRAIEAWVRGLASLRPLARDRGRAGFRQFRDEEERARARHAYEKLGDAAEVYPGFTSIELYRALAASAACDREQALNALARAAYAGETRETALASIELIVRGGDDGKRQEALAHIARLRDRAARPDPWLIAIAEDAEERCP